MPKSSGKSSASTATRKKHARRAVGHGEEQVPTAKPKDKKQKGKGKLAIEPRKKAFVLPAKPAPAQADPLDTLGLVHQLPGELVVILRKLGKKDETTKTKALEELQSEWIERKRDSVDQILEMILPVWLHRVPMMFLHSSRRVRLLAVTIHAKLLRSVHVRHQLFFHLREVASTDEAESVLGSWCMAAHDLDRQVATTARRSLEEHASITISDERLTVSTSLLIAFVQRAVLDPLGLYTYLNPVQVPVNITPPKVVRGRPVPVPPTGRKVEDPEPARSGDEESEDDRKARLRVGGLGVLQWLLDSRARTEGEKSIADLAETLSEPSLWTGLQAISEDSSVFGFGQPLVRSATWKLLHALVRHWKADIRPLVPMLSVVVLRSAFVEPDTQVQSVLLAPWLTFLKEFPDAWLLEAADSSHDESDDDDSTDAGKEGELIPEAPLAKQSVAFREFLQFLELGCGGAPIQGYPTILIVLSTIPPSVIAQADIGAPGPYPGSTLLTSFWAALDGRALSSTLERATTSIAFLSALLECSAFIARRLRSETQGPILLSNRDGQSGEFAAKALIREQYARVWEEAGQRRLRVDAVQSARIVAKGLTALQADSVDLFSEAWDAFVPNLTMQAVEGQVSPLIFARTFREVFEDDTHARMAADALLQTIASSIILNARSTLEQDGETGSSQFGALTALIDTLGAAIFDDAQLSQDLRDIIQSGVYKLAGTVPEILSSYLSHRPDQALWENLLATISARPALIYSTLPELVSAAERSALPTALRPIDQALDSAMAALFSDAASNQDSKALALILRIIRHRELFISEDSFETLLHLIVARLDEHCSTLMAGTNDIIPQLEVLLDIVAVAVSPPSGFSAPTELAQALIPNIFLVTRLAGSSFDEEEVSKCTRIASRILEGWTLTVEKSDIEGVSDAIEHKLHEIVCDVTAKATPRDILRAAALPQLPVRIDVFNVLPDRASLDCLAAMLNPDPAHPSLAVVLPLILPAASFDSAEEPQPSTDASGFGAYARMVSAWLYAATEDRLMAREQLWVLRHLIIVGVLAEEALSLPELQSQTFAHDVQSSTLEDILLKVQRLAAYLLSTPRDEQWHASVTSAAASGKIVGLDATGSFVAELVHSSTDEDTYRDSRVVFDVLSYILSDASTTEADLWMGLARKLERNAKQTSLAIVQAVARSGSEPMRLDRYRNELAADALGIPASQVNDKGLILLRRLVVSAPDPDSGVAFLPQQRAVNFVKACNSWLASDEDVDEDVESELTGVFVHLIPILQNVQGSHWELMLDVVESNLENSSFSDDLSLTCLWRSLKLVETIQEFATYNKALREIWSARRTSILGLVLKLVSEKKSETGYSEPRSVCKEAALLLIQDMPSSLLNEESLSHLTHLLSDPSTASLKISYELLRQAAQKRTEYLVIEAGVDLESQVKPELAAELVAFVQQQTIDLADPTGEKGSHIFSLLLGWMVFLDLFEGTSAKVRTGYVEQLTFLDLVATHLLPTISALLNIGPNGKPFKLDIWAVDTFYISEADPDDILSMRLFAAHVYYRALITIPSLVRYWLTTYNDRSTQSTIATYTSTYFSPPIIANELSRIRGSAEKGELKAENFAVKLATAVREISAVYTVDDQQLEFTLKIPANWPLQRIELRDAKLVGVSESQWRGWLLGVQQIVWSQNGHVLDAVVHFKNNVVLHFEGQVECPICYSIVSASEGSLPTKPCRTCKNRFHASCLYKWFESSHSSSCPLCRSDIM